MAGYVVTKARPSLGRDQTLEIIAQVADLAGVTTYDPVELDRDYFCKHALDGMDENIDFRKRKAFLKVESAFRAAREAILALDKRDQAILRFAFCRQWEDRIQERQARKATWNRDLDELLWILSQFTGSNPFPARPDGRGRPRGTVENWQLQKFIEILWETAKHCGGNLYADHKRAEGGTMMKALELLRPVLPEGLLPKTLSVSTVEAIIKNFKASGRTWY
jgi:hypothetical protein